MTNSKSEKPEVEEQDEEMIIINENEEEDHSLFVNLNNEDNLAESDSDLDQICSSVETGNFFN